MKVDVKNNNNFEANIKRSLAGNQYILTIKSGDKTIDIIFENYDELKTVHNIIGRELMTAYTFESVTIDAINENNNKGRSGGSGGIHKISTSSYTNTSGKEYSDTKPI